LPTAPDGVVLEQLLLVDNSEEISGLASTRLHKRLNALAVDVRPYSAVPELEF